MCKLLGQNFVQYLPVVMGPLMKAAGIRPEVAMLDSQDVDNVEEDEGWEFIKLGDQVNWKANFDFCNLPFNVMYFSEEFWNKNNWFRTESNCLSNACLLCSGTERRFCWVCRERCKVDGASAQVLFP